jgi:CBS-domain-containing membrane protein
MNDSVHKAAALLSFHELEAAPVVDATGRLIGTISAEACAAWEDYSRRTSPHGFSAADLDETSILDILSPGVDTVHDDAPAREVIDTLVRRNARRVYVVNAEEELLGVISMGDVLRCLGDGAGTRRVSHAAAAHLC